MTLDEHKALLAEMIDAGLSVNRKTEQMLLHVRRYIRDNDLPLVASIVNGVVTIADAT